jgi:NADH-quinone oxidoreductase subunit M
VKRVILGEVANDKVAKLQDLTGREFLVLGVLAVVVILFGIWPAPLMDVMRASTEHLAQQMLISKIAP